MRIILLSRIGNLEKPSLPLLSHKYNQYGNRFYVFHFINVSINPDSAWVLNLSDFFGILSRAIDISFAFFFYLFLKLISGERRD